MHQKFGYTLDQITSLLIPEMRKLSVYLGYHVNTLPNHGIDLTMD